MARFHRMHIQPKYFDLMAEGKKTVELRLNDEKRQSIQRGDIITFQHKNDADKEITLTVRETVRARDFSALISQCPASILGGVAVDEQLKQLRQIYSLEDESFFGVIAIILESENVQ